MICSHGFEIVNLVEIWYLVDILTTIRALPDTKQGRILGEESWVCIHTHCRYGRRHAGDLQMVSGLGMLLTTIYYQEACVTPYVGCSLENLRMVWGLRRAFRVS